MMCVTDRWAVAEKPFWYRGVEFNTIFTY